MPRGCAFCGVGVMTQCSVPGCENYICPRHTDESGRCKADDLGVIVHEEPKRTRTKRAVAVVGEAAATVDAEPATTEPVKAPRRRQKRASKKPSS